MNVFTDRDCRDHLADIRAVFYRRIAVGEIGQSDLVSDRYVVLGR